MSPTPCTATSCPTLQLLGVKVSVPDGPHGTRAGQTPASFGLPLVTVTSTFAVGLLLRATVNLVRASVERQPSSIVSAVFETESPAPSRSTVRAFADTVASLS